MLSIKKYTHYFDRMGGDESKHINYRLSSVSIGDLQCLFTLNDHASSIGAARRKTQPDQSDAMQRDKSCLCKLGQRRDTTRCSIWILHFTHPNTLQCWVDKPVDAFVIGKFAGGCTRGWRCAGLYTDKLRIDGSMNWSADVQKSEQKSSWRAINLTLRVWRTDWLAIGWVGKHVERTNGTDGRDKFADRRADHTGGTGGVLLFQWIMPNLDSENKISYIDFLTIVRMSNTYNLSNCTCMLIWRKCSL